MLTGRQSRARESRKMSQDLDDSKAAKTARLKAAVAISFADAALGEIPEICQGCRFGTGDQRDCTLISAKRFDTLFGKGPCHLDRGFKKQVVLFMATNYPDHRPQAALIADKILARLCSDPKVFPGDELQRLPETKIWMARFIRNDVIDVLVRQEELDPPRCRQCRSFSDSGCRLEHIPTPSGKLAPNPWWGDSVQGKSEPRTLTPSCEQFEFKSMIEADPLAELFGPESSALGSTISFIEAIDTLAKRGETEFSEALILRRHLVGQEPLDEIAENSQVPFEFVQDHMNSARVKVLQIMSSQAIKSSQGEGDDLL